MLDSFEALSYLDAARAKILCDMRRDYQLLLELRGEDGEQGDPLALADRRVATYPTLEAVPGRG